MPITEIAWFKSTSAYQADHSLLNDLVAKLSKVDGVLATYLGFQTEDPTLAYIVNVWDSLAHHNAITTHPSYSEIFGSLSAAAEDPSKVEIIVVETTSAPDKALSAATTEIVTATLKPGVQKEELIAVFEGLAKTGVTDGYHWGPVHGKSDTFAGIVGWDSLAAQDEASQKHPEFSPLAKKGGTLVTPYLIHVDFWKA